MQVAIFCSFNKHVCCYWSVYVQSVIFATTASIFWPFCTWTLVSWFPHCILLHLFSERTSRFSGTGFFMGRISCRATQPSVSSEYCCEGNTALGLTSVLALSVFHPQLVITMLDVIIMQCCEWLVTWSKCDCVIHCLLSAKNTYCRQMCR